MSDHGLTKPPSALPVESVRATTASPPPIPASAVVHAANAASETARQASASPADGHSPTSRLAHRIVALQPRSFANVTRAGSGVATAPQTLRVNDAIHPRLLGFDPARIARTQLSASAAPLPAELRPPLPPLLSLAQPLASITSLLPPPPVPTPIAEYLMPAVAPTYPLQAYEPPLPILEQAPGFVFGITLACVIGIALYIALVS